MTRLKELAKKYGLKQEDIANIIHKSRPTVSKYMTGKILPDIETYILLADYLSVSLDELVGRSSDYVIFKKEKYEKIKAILEQLNKEIK